MSYQVLARKWRPRNFEQLVGQEHVVRALVNGLDHDRLHHAFLFTGTRGVGKTTIARILAKSLNCEKGVSSRPCGECGACTDIDDGRFVDLLEVDAASRTKVDDTRDLLENVQYAPGRGRYKVYLIDEVHMLSNHSFNALLKTLEEPPPHVKFLLATTDPQKLPVTILSRCLQFNLKRLPAGHIADYLAKLLTSEEVPAEEAGIGLIARAADGSMRDALSLLDQAISYGGGRIDEDDVATMLGTVERGRVADVLRAVAAGDGPVLWQQVSELAEYAPDFPGVLRELAELLHRIAMLQAIGGEAGEDEPAAVAELASRLSPEDVQLYYQIAVHGRNDIDLAPDPRSGFEMTLLRMLAFRPGGEGRIPTSDAGADSGEEARKAAVRAAAQMTSGTVAAEAETKAPAEPVSHAARAQPASTGSDPEVPTPAESSSRHEPVQSPPADRPPVVSHQEHPEAMTEGPQDEWAGLIAKLGLSGTAEVLASNSVLEREAQGVFRLRISSRQEHLRTPAAEEKIRAAVARFFGKDVRVHYEVGEIEQETPAEARDRESDERQQAAQRAIDSDPVVRELESTFGAKVVPESVRPTDH